MDQKWIKKTNALKSEWTKLQINNNQEKYKTQKQRNQKQCDQIGKKIKLNKISSDEIGKKNFKKHQKSNKQ